MRRMPYAILGPKQERTLEYDVLDAATGAMMRMTICTGAFALNAQGPIPNPQTTAMGFVVPECNPLPAMGPDPIVTAELTLSQVAGHASGLVIYGVGEVRPLLLPDAQIGGMRRVHLSFVPVGGEHMALRYRVTVYRPR